MAWSLPAGAVLGMFGRQPVPGRVKTRLATEFGSEFAAEVHAAMLFDSLDTWSNEAGFLTPGGRRVFVFDPPDAGSWFDPRVPEEFSLQPQVEGDLGQRMKAFFEGEFADGATRVVLIGSDSPSLNPSYVISAFLCLDGRDVVLGPATDGGYYLVGCRAPVPPIFEGVEWGSSRVLSQTIDRLRDTRLSLAVLPAWYDVDTPDDWRMLAGHVRALRRADMSAGLRRVETLIERVG